MENLSFEKGNQLEKYNKTSKLLDAYINGYTSRIDEREKQGDKEAARALKEVLQEYEFAKSALENGDTQPTIDKITEIIKFQAEALKNKDRDSSPEGNITTIRQCLEYLDEITDSETKRQRSGITSYLPR